MTNPSNLIEGVKMINRILEAAFVGLAVLLGTYVIVRAALG